MKLEISLFRFDYKSDYLPYYTKNYIKVIKEKNLLDILNSINKEYPFGYKNDFEFCLAVNGIYTNVSVSIEKLVENFGKDLIIEPLSIRRSHTDLLINDADFQERLKILSKFIDNEDIKKYQSYKIYFYASNSINFEYDYIGDSLLLLAYDLIEKNKDNEKYILKALKEYKYGAQFYTSLEKRVLDFDPLIKEKIESIRTKLKIKKDIEKQEFSSDKKQYLDFGIFNEPLKIEHDFTDFNFAYYKGLENDTQTDELLSKLNAKIVNTQAMYSDLALNTFHINSDFTMKLASTVMLDAIDNGADLLIVDDEKVFNLFDSNTEALKNISGREVNIPIIHKNELSKLVSGQHEEVKKTLHKHTINPEIV